MKYKKPTYDEYCAATRFAKIRYRFGVYIQLIAVILLLFLLYYTITNIDEMKTNPKDYAEEKLGVICYKPFPINKYHINNGSYRNTNNFEQG